MTVTGHVTTLGTLSVCSATVLGMSANLRLELPVRNSDLPAHQKASEPCLTRITLLPHPSDPSPTPLGGGTL